MALPTHYIKIDAGEGWGEYYVVEIGGDGDYISVVGEINDKLRTGSSYKGMKDAYDAGAPVLFHKYVQGTYHAYDSDDEDAGGTPVIHPIEDWMWEFYPFYDDGQRALNKLGGVAPGISPTIVVPPENVVASTANINSQSYTSIEITPFAPWYILRNGQKRQIRRVELVPTLNRMRVWQEDSLNSFSGYELRATQTWVSGSVTNTTTEKGVLNASNVVVNTASLLSNFAAGRETTLYLAPETASGEAADDNAGVVGTVGAVYTSATAPTGPPSGVTWSTANNELQNLPTDWQALADYDPATDLGVGEYPWMSFAFVGANGTLGSFSDPVYSGDQAIEYSVDGSTSWHTTKATADNYYRYFNNGAWSPAIAINPKATMQWKVLTTINRTSTLSTDGNFFTRKDLSPPLDIADISEIMILRRTTAGTNNGMRRFTKPIPINEFTQSAQNFRSVADGPTFGGKRMLVALGWDGGSRTDVFPLHPNITLGSESNPGVDFAFFLTMMRPDGEGVGSSKIKVFEINKSTSHVNSEIDILGR